LNLYNKSTISPNVTLNTFGTVGTFEKDLYSTYLSYLPSTDFSYPLLMNVDDRGSFTEFIKTPDRGPLYLIRLEIFRF
jgi:UDP-2-acetamido-2,6-beta-L-arabino-hexul-4-ose reductase